MADHRFDEEALTRSGRGLSLASLVVGLLTGLGVYLVGEYWLDGVEGESGLAVAALLFVISLGASWLLLAERSDLWRPIIGALVIAGLIAAPTAWLFTEAFAHQSMLTESPLFFWTGLAGPLAAYFMVVLVKSVLDSGAPPHYTAVFFHGLTFPLILAGSGVIAGLALALLFAWANLLKALDVAFFLEVFQKPWFILPFLGAAGGFAVGTMRGQQAVLGALRFVLILIGRLMSPIMAVFSLTLIAVLALKGLKPVVDYPYPAAAMIGLACAGILIFNAVYQNGRLAPPPAWLRISTDIVLATLPVYAGLALFALCLRVDQYGLTPPRLAGLVIAALAFSYSLVCAAALVTEPNWRARRWAPLAGPLNSGLAAAAVLVLLATATPVLNPWAISARSQERVLAEGRVPAADFDYGYLRFDLGPYGEKALDRLLELDDHPEASVIAAEIAKVRSFKDRWEYGSGVRDSGLLPKPADSEIEADKEKETGIMDLPLNPNEGSDG